MSHLNNEPVYYLEFLGKEIPHKRIVQGSLGTMTVLLIAGGCFLFAGKHFFASASQQQTALLASAVSASGIFIVLIVSYAYRKKEAIQAPILPQRTQQAAIHPLLASGNVTFFSRRLPDGTTYFFLTKHPRYFEEFLRNCESVGLRESVELLVGKTEGIVGVLKEVVEEVVEEIEDFGITGEVWKRSLQIEAIGGGIKENIDGSFEYDAHGKKSRFQIEVEDSFALVLEGKYYRHDLR